PAEGPVLSLAEALDVARTQSPDLAVALERVTQARNNTQRAWAALKPTLNATGTLTFNSVGNAVSAETSTAPFFTVTEGRRTTESAALNFAWTLFNFRAFPAIATAYQQVDVARFTEAQQRSELLLSVASTYYSGLALKELAQV